MAQSKFCIQVKDLCKSFGSHIVLDNLNLNIIQGKISYIVGRSGEGKSVTVKHLVGLLKPDKGQIFIENVPVQNASEKQWREIRKKIGLLFQDGALFDSINVFENVAFPLMNHTKQSMEPNKRACKRTLRIGRITKYRRKIFI